MDIVGKLKEYATGQQTNDAKPATVTLPIEEYKRLKAIEGAAMEACDHFGYLSRVGSMARNDDEVVAQLGQALSLSKPAEEPAEERIPTGELALIQELADITGDEAVYE